MDWIIKYFNVREDIDLIFLVIKFLGVAILLMMFTSYYTKIMRIVNSFFTFSKPTIKKFAANVRHSGSGKKIEIYWEVKGAYSLELIPVILKLNFYNSLKIKLEGFISKIFMPFLRNNTALRSRFSKLNRIHNNLNLLNSKLSLSNGSYRFYSEDSNIKLSLKAHGIWGTRENNILIATDITDDIKNSIQVKSNNTDNNRKLEHFVSKIFLSLTKTTLNEKSKSLIAENRSPEFHKKHLLLKNNTFEVLRIINKQLNNPKNNSIFKSKKIYFSSHFKQTDFRKTLLEYRAHLIRTSNFDN